MFLQARALNAAASCIVNHHYQCIEKKISGDRFYSVMAHAFG